VPAAERYSLLLFIFVFEMSVPNVLTNIGLARLQTEPARQGQAVSQSLNAGCMSWVVDEEIGVLVG